MNFNNERKISIAFFESSHEKTLFDFQLSEEQKKFTGMPVDVIPLSVQDPERFPIVILANDQPVGFFVLHEGEAVCSYSQNKTAILLRAFSIDQKSQGKGYAKKALGLLPDFVRYHFPEKTEIVLAVNLKNHHAHQLYTACGFTDHGIRKEGSIGMQYILQYHL